MKFILSWVAAAFGKTWYLGEVKSIGDGEIEVLCMERIHRASDSFMWPENEDLGQYSYDEIFVLLLIPHFLK